MICPNCKTPAPDQANFCGICGANLTRPDAEAASAPAVSPLTAAATPPIDTGATMFGAPRFIPAGDPSSQADATADTAFMAQLSPDPTVPDTGGAVGVDLLVQTDPEESTRPTLPEGAPSVKDDVAADPPADGSAATEESESVSLADTVTGADAKRIETPAAPSTSAVETSTEKIVERPAEPRDEANAPDPPGELASDEEALSKRGKKRGKKKKGKKKRADTAEEPAVTKPQPAPEPVIPEPNKQPAPAPAPTPSQAQPSANAADAAKPQEGGFRETIWFMESLDPESLNASDGEDPRLIQDKYREDAREVADEDRRQFSLRAPGSATKSESRAQLKAAQRELSGGRDGGGRGMVTLAVVAIVLVGLGVAAWFLFLK